MSSVVICVFAMLKLFAVLELGLERAGSNKGKAYASRCLKRSGFKNRKKTINEVKKTNLVDRVTACVVCPLAWFVFSGSHSLSFQENFVCRSFSSSVNIVQLYARDSNSRAFCKLFNTETLISENRIFVMAVACVVYSQLGSFVGYRRSSLFTKFFGSQ